MLSLNALPSLQGTGIERTPCAYPGSPPAQQADCIQRREAKRGVDLGHHLSALEQVHLIRAELMEDPFDIH